MYFKKVGCFVTAIGLLVLSIFPISVIAKQNHPYHISSGNFEKGYKYNIKGWTYIHLEGDPFDRGYQYGYLAASEITDMIQRWTNFIHYIPNYKISIIKNLIKNYDEISNLWWNICRSKSMRYFEKHIPNENREEIKGLVAGLNNRGAKIFGRNIEYEDIVASQFVQEVWYAFFHSSSKYRFHPIRKIIFSIKDILNTRPNKKEIGHCHALIATGDATETGEIFVAHATIFSAYIAQRCNFIVDIKPTTGYRFIMTAPPGSLWSQEDFYQNEKGIILTETELIPQGPFNIRKTPKGIRSRTAIQYSANIDEVIKNLQKGNSGLIPNEWLIGDTKTGEIARLEQALYNTPITRTKNGIFTSYCKPHNDKVERELFVIYSKTKAAKKYNTYNEVKKKFDEFEREFYGEINTEILKKIFSTDPISQSVTDCKISGTKLLENMGLVVYFGWLNGSEFNPSDKLKQNFRGITNLPSSGWLEIYDSNFKNTGLRGTDNSNFKKESKVIWNHELKTPQDKNPPSNILLDRILIVSYPSGPHPAYDVKNKKALWNIKFEENILQLTASDKSVFIGTENGIYKVKKENGEILWYKSEGEVASKPVVYKNSVLVSFSNGYLNGFEKESGKKLWSSKFLDKPYISEAKKNIISIAAGKSCYGFDIDKQKIIWEFNTEKMISASPRLSGNTVYVGSWDGNIYALDRKTGDLKWKYQTGWAIDSTPDISKGLVFVGSLDNNLYALDEKSGSLEWYFTCKSAIHSNPIAYGNNVFFGCDDGRFYALNKTNGKPEWSFTPGYSINNDANNYITTPIVSNPIVENGVVYFSTKGTVYALDAQTFEDSENPLERKTDLNMGIIIISLTILIICIIILYNVKIKNKRSI
jgi:outer membrane protein assembly factor BamB